MSLLRQRMTKVEKHITSLLYVFLQRRCWLTVAPKVELDDFLLTPIVALCAQGFSCSFYWKICPTGMLKRV